MIASLIGTCTPAGAEPCADRAEMVFRIGQGDLDSCVGDLPPWVTPQPWP